jgi:hypothetical protein
MDDSPKPPAARMLTFEQARAEQRLYWAGKSMQERLTAMAELTRRMYKLRGIDVDQPWSDFPARRIRRRQG